MGKTLQIVHLEDNPRDAELVRGILEGAGISCDMRVVHSHSDFERELQRQNIDLILSDFSMPSYDGLSALKLAREKRPDVPFVFVSGKIGEEAAIESLRSGASDYLIKDRLARLPVAVERAINEAEERNKRKQAEATLREQEAKLLRTQRLESLGTLAGGIAHDLNNVLLPILLGLEVLRPKLTNKADEEILTMLEKCVARGTSMVKQILTFARGTEGQKRLLNPGYLLRDVVHLAQQTFPSTITVRSNVSKNLSAVEGDPTQLHQVLLNLAVNARDAMPDGGTLILSARDVPAAEVSHRFASDLSPVNCVLLEISDTGEGIPEAIRERIFEPFFTTKKMDKGTGLGLSTTLGIVKSHGGYIDFQTAVGRGTTFRIYLPAAGAAVVTELRSEVRPELSGGVEVVLIIDDELGAREMTKMVLGMHAYQVLTAGNGAEGLNTFKSFQDRIDVVIVDRNMPLMDGPATIQAIRAIRPQVKIIGTTGLGVDLAETEFAVAGVDAFLPKPFTAEQLLTVLDKFFGRERN